MATPSLPIFKPLPGRRRDTQPMGEIVRENVFAPYRKRILYPASAVGALVILPLAAHHIMERNHALGAVMVALVAMLWVDTLALRRGREPPLPMALLLLPAIAGVAIGLPSHGLHGVLWAFPTLMFAYFALSRGAANRVAMAMLAVGGALLFAYQDAGIAIRFLVALGLCVVILNILLDVLDSLQAKLVGQSLTDPPTGAFSRRHLDNCLGHVVERRRRNGATASLLVLDLDRFGRVNDRIGVAGGDQVLRAFVDLARAALRDAGVVCRCGGQKFAVLLPGLPEGEAALLAERLRAAVAGKALAQGVEVTVSIGVAELRSDEAPEGWFKRADGALRNAKDEGRNRVMVCRLSGKPYGLAGLEAP